MKRSILAVATLTLTPVCAHAGGVFVGEAGSQAMERAGAFVAKADDPTALSTNPAGLAKLDRLQLYLGVNALNYSLSYQRSGTYESQPLRETQPAYVGTPYPGVENGASFQPIPYFAAGGKWKNLAIAGGFFAPPAVPNRKFDCPVSDQFCQMDASGAPAPQRYDVVDQKAIIGYPSLALAYRLHERLDVGARFSWGFASIEARNFPWALPNGSEDVMREGDFEAKVSDNFIPNFGVGVLVRPTDFLEIGAAYKSKTQVRAKGTGTALLGPEAGIPGIDDPALVPKSDADALCGTGGTTSALKTCIDFDMPQSATLGVRFIFRDAQGGERADVEVDGKWENWADASDDTITVDGKDRDIGVPLKPVLNKHGFRDVLALSVGGAYRIDVGHNALALRAGFSYDTAAAPVSWTRVDKDGRARTTLAAGVGYELDRWRFDLGVAVVVEGVQKVEDVPLNNTKVDNRVQPDPLQPALQQTMTVYHPYNAGVYDSGYVVGLAGVTAMF